MYLRFVFQWPNSFHYAFTHILVLPVKTWPQRFVREQYIAHSFSLYTHLIYPSYPHYVTLDLRVECLTFLSRSTSRVRFLSFDLIAVSSCKVKSTVYKSLNMAEIHFKFPIAPSLYCAPIPKNAVDVWFKSIFSFVCCFEEVITFM